MSIRYSNLFVSISAFILTLLVVMPFSVYAQQNEDNKDIVATAKRDAKSNESTSMWILGGCCLIGTGMAYVAKPAPKKIDLSDKSAEYVEIHEQAYESEAKKIRQKSAWIGTAGGVVAAIVGVYQLVAIAMVSSV